MSSPHGIHRVLEPAGVLPQQAWRLKTDPEPGADEVVLDVERLNLDAASLRQLHEQYGTGDAIRAAVLAMVAERGKLQNPVTGSGGMLVGVVRAVGPESPLGLQVGQRVASLVSLTLTPLLINDELRRWDGHSGQIPCAGTAVLFARSIVALMPVDLPTELALSVLDVCGAPALTDRVVRRRGPGTSVCVLGAAGRSGSLSLAAARRAGAGRLVAVVADRAQAQTVHAVKLADEVAVADARDPLAVAEAVGPQVDLSVVCVDVGGCEHAAILATADGGTVVFFSMATSFTAAALGAEGLAADVELLIGNGYTPGHAQLALELVRSNSGLRAVLEQPLLERRSGSGKTAPL
ncbi:MAG: L-erythro-3,5-diaminohexanoate dehydrogenase [Actinobacteria bacterium]|nr:L-erythro-3,5-diaminohexanoate dehydrogenase [Actinomycetota bacterium]